jgi:hypothetical protein
VLKVVEDVGKPSWGIARFFADVRDQAKSGSERLSFHSRVKRDRYTCIIFSTIQKTIPNVLPGSE